MKWLIRQTDSLEEITLQEVGGKAYNLLRMKQIHSYVPPFAILTSHNFDLWNKDGKLPPQVLNEIKEEIKSWDTHYVAVRSSMSGEDGAHHSYAGLFETFLFVSLEHDELEQTIYKCFASFQHNKISQYESILSQQKNTQPHQMLDGKNEKTFSVVIQKMVHSSISGVAFSRAPIGNSALTYIEAAFGLGEGVVAGMIDVDAYYMDRFQQIIETQIKEKKWQVNFESIRKEHQLQTHDHHHNHLSEVPLELQKKPTLTIEQLKLINQELLHLEKSYQKPVDIEWCFNQAGEFFIVQVRPITQSFPPLDYYTDINLSESYPGLTSPLTGSFVNKVYKKVFDEIADYMQMSKKRIKFLQQNNKNLVQYIDGHMYYHLPSYYNFLICLPGGKKNIENWHQMIGGHQEEKVDLTQIKKLSHRESLLFYFNLIKLVLFHKIIFRSFDEDAEINAQKLDYTLNHTQNADTLIKYLNLSIQRIQGFGLTALNDYLIMLCLGKIHSLLNKYAINHQVIPQLIKTHGQVESLLPLQAIDEIILHLGSHPHEWLTLNQIFLKDGQNWQKIFENLDKNHLHNLKRLIKNYLEKFGDRSFEELKLESFTFNQNPALFLKVLEMKYNFSQTDGFEVKSQDQDKEESAQQNNHKKNLMDQFQHFHLFDKIIFHITLKLSQRFIQTREKTRLTRGHFYGLVRKILVKAIIDLKMTHKQQFAAYSVLDFFSLTLDDLLLWAEKKITLDELKQRIDQKRSWQKLTPNFPEFFCHPQGSAEKPSFRQRESSAYEQKESTLINHSDQIKQQSLKGTGASTGIIRGEALILLNPLEGLHLPNMHKKILITKTTDPAWVYLMSQCCGLVSEKGSLLSHTAIIGRELGIPTIVAAKDVTSLLQNGQLIEINGLTGDIKIL